MSAGWEIGDRAVCVTCGYCAGCLTVPDEEIDTFPFDGPVTVVRVDSPYAGYDVPTLAFSCDGPDESWCSCGFRKIRPDEQEPCWVEFRELMDSMKPRVDA